MMPDMIRPAVVHGAVTLTLADFLMAMKRSRRLRPLLLDSFVEAYLVGLARSSGMSVSEEELQKAADDFRVRNGMASTEQTQQWFQREGITADDFAVGLERDLLVEKLRRTLVDGRVEETFNANTARFARVHLRRILVQTEQEAREVIDLIQTGKGTFEEVAAQRSLDLVTKASGGDMGIVRRVDLAQPLGDAIFATAIGGLTPPVNAGQGFLVFKVEKFLPAEMDDNIRAGIRKELFELWLRNELSKAPIQFPIMEELSK